MDIFDDLKFESIEYLFLEDLSTLECQAVILEAKRRRFAFERVGCWTRDKDYFKIHDWERFCPDYLIDIQEFPSKAYQQLIQSYHKEILSTDPANLPRFELMITRGYEPELAKIVSEDVKRLRGEPDYTPRDFEAYIAPEGISVE